MTPKRNPVGWFEIYVEDLPRAKAFYEATFDLTLESLPTPDPSVEMLFFPMDAGENGPGAPGALCKMQGVSPGAGGTLVYFSCEDCSVQEARAAGAGGHVVRPKFAIGEHGFIALVTDPEGNMIGLHSMA